MSASSAFQSLAAMTEEALSPMRKERESKEEIDETRMKIEED